MTENLGDDGSRPASAQGAWLPAAAVPPRQLLAPGPGLGGLRALLLGECGHARLRSSGSWVGADPPHRLVATGIVLRARGLNSPGLPWTALHRAQLLWAHRRSSLLQQEVEPRRRGTGASSQPPLATWAVHYRILARPCRLRRWCSAACRLRRGAAMWHIDFLL